MIFEAAKNTKYRKGRHTHTPFEIISRPKPRCIVWFHHCVGHLGRWNHGECFHDAIWIFLSHFGDQQCAHASASAAAKGMAKLETLQAITALCFFANDIQHRVDQLSAFGVVTLTGFAAFGACSL